MNTTRLQLTKHLFNYVRLINNVQRLQRLAPSCYQSTLTIDAFTSEVFERYKNHKFQRNDLADSSKQHYSHTSDINNIPKMSNEELDNAFSELLRKNKDKPIEYLIIQCQNCRKYLTYDTLKKLFRHYSLNGKPDMVIVLQNYCAIVDPKSYKQNGEFLHYLAKAQCIRGNSDIGLSILKNCYTKYDSLRSCYRVIFRELIQDSVLNRSEASLVIFRRYVMEFSNEFSDHYPLVCFWHICWASTWFSDQMLGNELLETSEILLNIVRDKATAFSIMVLKDYNEDAVVRLLQTLIKHDFMMEYVAVLQVLFNYKCFIYKEEIVHTTEERKKHFSPPWYILRCWVRNRDIRGCTEIIRNCEALGVNLPSDQQGRYIKMLIIDDKKTLLRPKDSTKTKSKDFKLKF